MSEMNDLRIIMVLLYKDEMIEKGLIPKDVKWDQLTKEQEDNVKKFIEEKIESQKMKGKGGRIIC